VHCQKAFLEDVKKPNLKIRFQYSTPFFLFVILKKIKKNTKKKKSNTQTYPMGLWSVLHNYKTGHDPVLQRIARVTSQDKNKNKNMHLNYIFVFLSWNKFLSP
jgi:hypothetical protein